MNTAEGAVGSTTERREGSRIARIAAAAGAAATAMLLSGARLLAVRNGVGNPLASNQGPDLIIPLGITAVGAVVVALRSSNTVGWLFLVSGVLDAVRAAASEYAIRGFAAPGTMAAPDWAAWVSAARWSTARSPC